MLTVITKDTLCSHLNYEIFRQLETFNDPHMLVVKNLTKHFYSAKFPIVNYSKIFSGYFSSSDLIIATDLSSAETLIKTKNKARKLFYVWDLEFLTNKNFDRNIEVYNNITLLTRSTSYKQALENYCNNNVHVLEFNLEKIWTKNTL